MINNNYEEYIEKSACKVLLMIDNTFNYVFSAMPLMKDFAQRSLHLHQLFIGILCQKRLIINRPNKNNKEVSKSAFKIENNS